MNDDEPEVLCHWSARKVHPVVLLYVAGVFAGFIVLAHFVFHSKEAVMALAMAAVAGIVPLVPAVITRIEYRLTERGLDKRPRKPKEEPGEYSNVFALDRLSHVKPIRHGFKYYLPFNASNPLQRFYKLHISDAFSGEVHVETADLERVLDVLAAHGIPRR